MGGADSCACATAYRSGYNRIKLSCAGKSRGRAHQQDAAVADDDLVVDVGRAQQAGLAHRAVAAHRCVRWQAGRRGPTVAQSALHTPPTLCDHTLYCDDMDSTFSLSYSLLVDGKGEQMKLEAVERLEQFFTCFSLAEGVQAPPHLSACFLATCLLC